MPVDTEALAKWCQAKGRTAPYERLCRPCKGYFAGLKALKQPGMRTTFPDGRAAANASKVILGKEKASKDDKRNRK